MGIFCLPSETDGWIRKTIVSCGLNAFRVVSEHERYTLELTDIVPAATSKDRELYLLPVHDHRIRVDELRSVIRFWLPIISNRCLCMATFGISKPPVDKNSSGFTNRSKVFRELCREIRKSCHLGVYGINVSTGKRHLYKDIAVTNGVKVGIHRFEALKPAMCDTFVEFVPSFD